MSLDVSKLSATPNYSSLLPSNKGALGDNLLSQWSLLRSNGKALKAAMRAEERGYLRDSDAPKTELMSDKLYPAKERSTTIADILAQMGREPTVVEGEQAAEPEAGAAADAGDSSESSGDKSGGVDVIA